MKVQLPTIGISKDDIQVYTSPKRYADQLLTLIGQAKERIYITALYIQDDAAGQEILHALYQAKQAKPSLDIKLFVDYHRAQRGLIGEKDSLGNRSLYLALANEYEHPIDIHGVAVKSKELLGVLHLKGMVFDNELMYSGASINDVYLHKEQRYRLDRYYQLSSKALADQFCSLLNKEFVNSNLCPLLNQDNLPNKVAQKTNIQRLKANLKVASYTHESTLASVNDELTITPFIGSGPRNNQLNNAIRSVVQNSQRELTIFTPYFNLPKPLLKDVIRALKRGVHITIVVGDKKANDFFIANDNKFSTIGIVPYLYEMLLVRFLRRWQHFINSGLLDVRLWQDGENSFHLKGIVADNRYHLLTGSNLNPRAWSLDLENGLLIDDPQGHMMAGFEQEMQAICQNTWSVNHYQQLEKISDYPEKPRKLLNKIRLSSIDRLLKRFL